MQTVLNVRDDETGEDIVFAPCVLVVKDGLGEGWGFADADEVAIGFQDNEDGIAFVLSAEGCGKGKGQRRTQNGDSNLAEVDGVMDWGFNGRQLDGHGD